MEVGYKIVSITDDVDAVPPSPLPFHKKAISADCLAVSSVSGAVEPA